MKSFLQNCINCLQPRSSDQLSNKSPVWQKFLNSYRLEAVSKPWVCGQGSDVFEREGHVVGLHHGGEQDGHGDVVEDGGGGGAAHGEEGGGAHAVPDVAHFPLPCHLETLEQTCWEVKLPMLVNCVSGIKCNVIMIT